MESLKDYHNMNNKFVLQIFSAARGSGTQRKNLYYKMVYKSGEP